MTSSRPINVFCYADREDAGKYKIVRIPQDAEVSPSDLWISGQLGRAEGALHGQRHAFGNAQDAAFVWALATHVVDEPLPDGRGHKFTHLVVARSPYDARLLEYGVLKAYEGAPGLIRFGNTLYGKPDSERRAALEALAATVTALTGPSEPSGLRAIPPAPSAVAAASSTSPRVRGYALVTLLCCVSAMLGSGVATWLVNAHFPTPTPVPTPPDVFDNHADRQPADPSVLPRAQSRPTKR